MGAMMLFMDPLRFVRHSSAISVATAVVWGEGHAPVGAVLSRTANRAQALSRCCLSADSSGSKTGISRSEDVVTSRWACSR